MANLKKLSVAQLNKIIDDTRVELTRRKNIDAATAELRSILKKYKIDFQDINPNIIIGSGSRSSAKKHARVTKSRDRRSTVQAKYGDPNSRATWTGRGRTPAWVKGICRNEGIDIEAFKKDYRFRC